MHIFINVCTYIYIHTHICTCIQSICTTGTKSKKLPDVNLRVHMMDISIYMYILIQMYTFDNTCENFDTNICTEFWRQYLYNLYVFVCVGSMRERQRTLLVDVFICGRSKRKRQWNCNTLQQTLDIRHELLKHLTTGGGCLYVFICVYMCLYVFICVYMCLYVFICESSK